MKTTQFFKKISLWSILGTAFLSVLLVVPLTDNFISHTKNYLLLLSSILVILFFILKILKERAVKITISPLTGALLFFGLTAVASTFFASSYPVESLLGMGGVYISATIIAILGGSLVPKDSILKFVTGMTITGIALTVLTVLQMIGFGPAQLINKLIGSNLPTSMVFSIAGSPFIALQVIGVTFVGIFASIKAGANKKMNKFFMISLPILAIGAGIFAWGLLPGKETSLVLPPLNTSWSVMLDSIRNPRSALIGAGPNAYSNLYTAFKPSWMNNTDQWSAVFSQATNFPLTLLSTMGAIGLTAWIFIAIKLARVYKTSLISSKPAIYMIGASLLLQVFLPVNTVMLTIQAVAIACLIANEKHKLPLLQLQALKFKVLNRGDFDKSSKAVNLPLYLFSGLSMVGVATMFYLVGRSYNANILMTKSSKALAKNDLVGAYELQQKAVQLNPYLDTFRRRYSLTNIGIALALSNKADISDAEKNQVSSLLQQSIREARAATTLDPMESANWSNLAQIYQNMIGVSDDAAQWTVQSYVSAIEADPNNPSLRLSLAGVFIAQENYQQAISILSQAISLKPDLAGSHYNLALVLEKIESPEAYREARLSYQRALVLLEADSEEYVIVNQKIEDLESMMAEKGISIEPEQQGDGQANDQDTGGTQAPSITDQNLNNSGEANPTENKDVDLTPPAQDLMDQGAIDETNLSEELN